MRRLVVAVIAASLLGAQVVEALPTSPGLDDAQALAAFAARPAGVEVASRRSLRSQLDQRGAEVVRVDRRAVKRALGRAVLELPAPGGDVVEFEVQPVEVMEPALAARHPELAVYAGRSVGDPATTVSVAVTPLGVSASVRGPREWVVEPAGTSGGARHVVGVGGLDARSGRQTALAARPPTDVLVPTSTASRSSEAARPPSGEVVRRTYRLALLNDPTYAGYWGTDNVLAAKVALVTRLNQIYNDDHGIRFLLVEDSEKLNLDTDAEAIGPDGPCGSAPCFDDAVEQGEGMLDRCGTDTLGRTRLVLASLIGASAYDVGHLTLGVDGGGVAWLGVAGRDYAGGGCTGLTQPRGDVFYIDYVAHEIGHQFSAEHTFNGAGDFCGANGSDASVEPGSGSSVMAYAGICGADDLQPHTDPYFSQHSIEEVGDYIGADQADVVEVQQVSLRGFDNDGDTVTLSLGEQSTTLTRGSGYTRAAVQSAVSDLVGSDVRIARWDYDPYLGQVSSAAAAAGQPSDAGFQIVYASSLEPDVGGTRQDRPELVATGGAGVEAEVVEVARGGTARNGGEAEASGNSRPIVSAPARKTIPVRTPFKLRGSATDPDGDPLTFSWEQDDAGIGTALFSNGKVFGPLFRQFGDNARVTGAGALESPSPGQNTASTEPTRWFPDLDQVLRGRTNARTGKCPGVSGSSARDKVLDCYSEYLPTGQYRGAANVGRRTMHFRLTARDGNPDGGGTSYADVAIKVQRSAGPFLMRSQYGGRTEHAGQRMGVRWKVNGTKDLARKVRIRLSVDDGQTWGTVLANNTRNDGKKKVRLPAGITADAAWVMVEARGNYFYDVSDTPFKIR
ncbi:MAG: hypothetical protein CMH84_10780 [Nocardioides sp.]|nr:hypothetical protein [Nocardioides sp.]